jgi:sulfotransferase family protein
LSVFRFNKVFDVARDIKAFLSGKKSERREFRRITNKFERKKQERRRKRQELHNKRQEYRQIRSEVRAAKGRAEKQQHKKRGRRIQEEISQLGSELRAAKKQAEGAPDGRTVPPAEGEEPATGALPDFVIIGGKKCGTTSFYYLLTQHPLIQPCAKKELHFFDTVFDEGIEWYRGCFPAPRWEDGRRTITGEGTPYLAHLPVVPERMAQVVPRARLMALLRNPVDRAYSDYHHEARSGRETRTFEEAIGLEGAATGARETRPLDKEEKTPERGDRAGLHDNSEYLSRGVYVDQLLLWSKFFSEEQLLVLKSEDFFERPQETLEVVLGFLGLPEWEPGAWEIHKKGCYEEGMAPATRRRLEEYFEPHNRRLYEFLGRDFGW